MKKILSLVLALCIVLSMGAMAFAEEDTLGISSTGTNYLCDERTTLTVCTYDGVSQAFKRSATICASGSGWKSTPTFTLNGKFTPTRTTRRL